MIFVTFEGIDGCGKTSVSKEVEVRLRAAFPHRTVRRYCDPEMSYPDIAEIRKTLLDPNSQLTQIEELRLYIKARKLLIDIITETHIRAGTDSTDVVLCDRFIHSTYAYQGYGRGIPKKTIAQIHREEKALLFPDLTLWYDIPLGDARARSDKRSNGQKDRMEQQDDEFFTRVADGYQDMFDKERAVWNIQRVDATRAFNEVVTESLLRISRYL